MKYSKLHSYLFEFKKAKNKIAVLFLLGALVLLSYALYPKGSVEQDDKYLGHLDKHDRLFSETLFSSYLNLKDYSEDYDGILLFFVGSDFCSSCINEIIEYMTVTTEYLNSSLNGYKIFIYAFILGDNEDDYARVKKLLKFPFNSSLVKNNSELASILNQWNREITGINQIVLIDPAISMVKGRIGIFNTSTPLFVKKNLVQEVLFELEY